MSSLFFMLVLGIIEVSLYMQDNRGVANAARAGARTASASGDDLYADYHTMKLTLREASALDRDNIDYIVIYKPSAFGEAPTGNCLAGIPTKDRCNVFRPEDFGKDRDQFGCVDPTYPDYEWCPTERVVSLTGNGGEGSDYVGVYVKAHHPMVTKLFGSTKTITDLSVIRLEPRTKS